MAIFGLIGCASDGTPSVEPGRDAAGTVTSATSAPTRAALEAAERSASIAETAKAVEAAARGSQRSADHVARDVYRHPVETLAFFGLRDDMTVVEALPGGELWYTEILAPVLRDHGQLVVASYDLDAPGVVDYQRSAHAALLRRIEEEPEVFGRVEVGELSPPHGVDLGPPGSADLVLTFRSTHGWINGGVAADVYQAFYDVLKPGGVLGVVQHRAGPRTNREAFSGYVPEEVVIALAEQAGFVLEGQSEINANPRDTADWPAGVWTLPPSFRLGDRDRAQYRAIGESDRMTLRFRKPDPDPDRS
ncbi:MAG: methyltransferase [Myxococcota bacterium]